MCFLYGIEKLEFINIFNNDNHHYNLYYFIVYKPKNVTTEKFIKQETIHIYKKYISQIK